MIKILEVIIQKIKGDSSYKFEKNIALSAIINILYLRFSIIKRSYLQINTMQFQRTNFYR